jgi:hypothetical protein
MNPKIVLSFAIACFAMATFSPAKSQDASATPTTTAGAQVHVSELPTPRPHIATTVPKTPDGAGYFVYPTLAGQNVGSVSTTFTIPSITCQRHDDREWLLPGIWVYSGGTLTQQVDINLNCNNGTLLMQDVICIAGADCDQSLTVSPGDRIIATLSETASGTYGQIHNLTTGQIASASGQATTSDDTVFVGDEGPSLFGETWVPTFSSVPFSKVQINGYYLSDSPFPTRNNLATTNNTTQIKTTLIEGDGDHFVTMFNHN